VVVAAAEVKVVTAMAAAAEEEGCRAWTERRVR
jgi:hypothetical protein